MSGDVRIYLREVPYEACSAAQRADWDWLADTLLALAYEVTAPASDHTPDDQAAPVSGRETRKVKKN